MTPTATMRRLGLVCLVFLLSQISGLAVTPVGEGMDVYGHLAYTDFYAAQGRAPKPGELSMAAWIATLRQDLPGPDFSTTGERYRRWAGLAPEEQKRIADRLGATVETDVYVQANYQSQHPPLYYALLSPIYRLFKPSLPIGAQLYILGLVSVCMAMLAFPGLYLTLRLYLDETASLIALLGLAWFPNFLPFLGRITNDALAFPLMVWAVYFCLRCRGPQSRKSILIGGLLITLAGFTKTYALTLWPLYVACVFAGERRRRWREAGLALLIGCAGTGALLAFNQVTTGHIILLKQMVALESTPILERISWVARLNPIWFFGGLAKGFWWSGYWSFVSPGLIYYAPLGLLPALLFIRTRAAWRNALIALWPHLLAILAFVVAMVWHAATFALLANLQGQKEFSGNEGWYANVLVGCFASIALALLKPRMSPAALRRTLVATAVFMAVWNVFARFGLAAYWMGLTDIEGRNRGVIWTQALPAMLSPGAWQDWLALPGVIEPVALTSLLPLLLAIGLTAVALIRWLTRPRLIIPAT